MRVEITADELAPHLEAAVRSLVADAAVVSTETACQMLEVSRNTFLALVEGRGLRPVSLGPRMTRWRLADVKSLIS